MIYFSPAGGGVRVSVIPRVCRVLRDFPSSQVSLPFSRSMTNRSPVPAVKARSFCVTPKRLRVSRIMLPICLGVYFKFVSLRLPYGNIRLFQGKIQFYIPVREYKIRGRGGMWNMFLNGNFRVVNSVENPSFRSKYARILAGR